MNLVGILIAPIAITPIPMGARLAVVVVMLAALTVAVIFSKRGAITTVEEAQPHEAESEKVEAEVV